jgi:4'-phosphopantetheinyl transferase
MTLLDPQWTHSPVHLTLSADEVHVWRARLDRPAAEYARLLSSDEQARADRLRFEHLQRRFIVGRGTLRVILGRYLNVLPEEIEFEYRPNGKPVLSSGLLHSALCFNLSHSDEMLLLAVTYHRSVGIDLETIHPDLDVKNLAERFFSPAERAELEALPSDKKLDSFFSGWTCKEAYLKARGEGLTYPLDQFSVSMDCDKPAKLLDVKDDPGELSRWSFHTLAPAPGYIGALAVEGHHWHLAQWQLE